MTTSTLNPSVQEDLQTVQDTLYDIKCLAKLYHMLHHPRSINKLWNESYNSLEDLNLIEIGQALISVLDLGRLFPLLNNLTISGTDSLSGIIVLVNGEEVQLKASKGLPNHIANDTIFKVGDGAIGWVVKYGKPIIIDDVEKDPRFNKQQFRWYLGRTLLCVPIKVRGLVVGVISVSGKKIGEVYTDSDIRFLETVAVYTAIALENSDSCGKLKVSNKLGQVTSTYYDENNRYLPVTLRSIKMGAFTGCDLYLQTMVNNETKYLLYCKGNRLFDDERKESFVKKNINKIYVAKNGKAQYLRYIETNLEQILRDEMTALQERVKIVYDVAVNIMTDILKDSNVPATIERARDWTTITLNFMLRDRAVCPHLMKLLTYDENVFRHSVNMAIMGLLFGDYLDISANDLLILGTGLLLHDIGITGIEPSMVRKNLQKLTKEEMEQIRKHPDLGFILLTNSGNLSMEACLVAKQHHEHYNGKGYPEGLKGDDIHYFSRIARILDEYEMQMSRSTSSGENPAFQSLQNMVKGMEGNFDKEILKKFIGFMHTSTCEEYVEAEHNMVEFAR